MAWALVTAAVLILVLGAVHSILGERYIISRALRRDQPKLFGSDAFTKRTLRFVWHVTTIFAWAIGAILLVQPSNPIIAIVIATMLAAAGTTVVISRGQHLSWIVELFVAALLAWHLYAAP